jgi:hypothetical protein
MKIIATLAMTGAITAAEVDTLKNATPVQLAELEGMSEMLAQNTTEAGRCHRCVTNYHKAIKNYIARIQVWINANRDAKPADASSDSEDTVVVTDSESSDGDNTNDKKAEAVKRTCDGALNRLFHEQNVPLWRDNKDKTS